MFIKILLIFILFIFPAFAEPITKKLEIIIERFKKCI